jgi:hypothetical protein
LRCSGDRLPRVLDRPRPEEIYSPADDIRGVSSSGRKYRITMPDGITGTLTGGAFRCSYAFEVE